MDRGFDAASFLGQDGQAKLQTEEGSPCRALAAKLSLEFEQHLCEGGGRALTDLNDAPPFDEGGASKQAVDFEPHVHFGPLHGRRHHGRFTHHPLRP